MAKRDGKLWCVLGCMGADGQPQIQVQLYTAMIDHGLDIQEAIEMPRFLSGCFSLGEAWRDAFHTRRSRRSGCAAISSTAGIPGTRWPATLMASRSDRPA
jgi:gamma-glutamyltranspeptidase